MPKKQLLASLKQKKVMRLPELEKLVSHRNNLQPLVESGEIIALGVGLYADPSIDPFVSSIIAVSRFFPKAIISNVTALVIHGLSDERIDKIDVDIERNTSIRNKLIAAHRVPKHTMIGKTLLPFHDEKIRCYDIERSLCDAYRIDADGSIFLKAIKRYVRLGNIDTEGIARYDRKLKTNVLKALRQELADG